MSKPFFTFSSLPDLLLIISQKKIEVCCCRLNLTLVPQTEAKIENFCLVELPRADSTDVQ
jgi:hypothetical protein